MRLAAIDRASTLGLCRTSRCAGRPERKLWTTTTRNWLPLVAKVGEAIDRHRAGELDPFDVDHVLYHYSRSAKELWKFCNLTPVEIAAKIIRAEPPTDWWERGAPRSD